jgi:hypothetical protein
LVADGFDIGLVEPIPGSGQSERVEMVDIRVEFEERLDAHIVAQCR